MSIGILSIVVAVVLFLISAAGAGQAENKLPAEKDYKTIYAAVCPREF